MVSDSFAFAFSYDTSPAGICILRGLQPRPNRKSDSVGIMLLFMHGIGFSHSLRWFSSLAALTSAVYRAGFRLSLLPSCGR